MEGSVCSQDHCLPCWSDTVIVLGPCLNAQRWVNHLWAKYESDLILSSQIPFSVHTSIVPCSIHAFELSQAWKCMHCVPSVYLVNHKTYRKMGHKYEFHFSLQLLFPNILCPSKHLVCYNQDLYRSACRSPFYGLNRHWNGFILFHKRFQNLFHKI